MGFLSPLSVNEFGSVQATLIFLQVLHSRKVARKSPVGNVVIVRVSVVRVSLGKVGRVSQEQVMVAHCIFPHLSVPEWWRIRLTCQMY